MEKIVAIIENEIKRLEGEIAMLQWENEDLKKRIKELEGETKNGSV